MLQVKHLTLTHRKDLRTLAEDFSFVLNDGDKAVIIIGEEGNGKSTIVTRNGITSTDTRFLLLL